MMLVHWINTHRSEKRFMRVSVFAKQTYKFANRFHLHLVKGLRAGKYLQYIVIGIGEYTVYRLSFWISLYHDTVCVVFFLGCILVKLCYLSELIRVLYLFSYFPSPPSVIKYALSMIIKNLFVLIFSNYQVVIPTLKSSLNIKVHSKKNKVIFDFVAQSLP